MTWWEWAKIIGVVMFAVIAAIVIIAAIEDIPDDWPSSRGDDPPSFWWF